MSGMTSKRLAEIREAVRHDAPVVALLGGRGVYLAQLLAHVDHLTAKDARLREGIEMLHGAVQEFEPCPEPPWGCGELTCTESVHTGERYHDDQPTGRVCLTCRYEDGEPHDCPCETVALLDPPTEGEADHE